MVVGGSTLLLTPGTWRCLYQELEEACTSINFRSRRVFRLGHAGWKMASRQAVGGVDDVRDKHATRTHSLFFGY